MNDCEFFDQCDVWTDNAADYGMKASKLDLEGMEGDPSEALNGLLKITNRECESKTVGIRVGNGDIPAEIWCEVQRQTSARKAYKSQRITESDHHDWADKFTFTLVRRDVQRHDRLYAIYEITEWEFVGNVRVIPGYERIEQLQAEEAARNASK